MTASRRVTGLFAGLSLGATALFGSAGTCGMDAGEHSHVAAHQWHSQKAPVESHESHATRLANRGEKDGPVLTTMPHDDGVPAAQCPAPATCAPQPPMPASLLAMVASTAQLTVVSGHPLPPASASRAPDFPPPRA